MLNRNFVPFPTLVTDRLILRQPASSDAPQIFALRSDAEINKYMGRQASKTIDEARNFINSVNENTITNSSIYWAITFRNSNTLIGTICLYDFSDDGHCEIGYEMLTDSQGKGLMFEAAKKVIDYAFNTINVQKIAASLHKNNQRSIKLLEKLSFESADKLNENEPDLIAYFLINTIGSFRWKFKNLFKFFISIGRRTDENE